ncbi:MAG: hypothetical protein IKK23_03530 [Bacteroidales bacterium]|nr:hypothetical protein [Bacteroidales bacterium]MBR4094458.1 hypothetical protein [Bacteroidales bacterium]
MKNFILFILSALCVACSVARQAAPSENLSTRVEVVTVFEKDTVLVEIPQIVEKVQTMDTVSFLENEFAKSSAEVSDGILSHSLETKPVQKPVEIQKEIVYRDSVVFRDRTVVETVEVEKPLSGWQQFKIKTGGYAIGMIIGMIVCSVLYIVKPLKFIKL